MKVCTPKRKVVAGVVAHVKTPANPVVKENRSRSRHKHIEPISISTDNGTGIGFFEAKCILCFTCSNWSVTYNTKSVSWLPPGTFAEYGKGEPCPMCGYSESYEGHTESVPALGGGTVRVPTPLIPVKGEIGSILDCLKLVGGELGVPVGLELANTLMCNEPGGCTQDSKRLDAFIHSMESRGAVIKFTPMTVGFAAAFTIIKRMSMQLDIPDCELAYSLLVNFLRFGFCPSIADAGGYRVKIYSRSVKSRKILVEWFMTSMLKTYQIDVQLLMIGLAEKARSILEYDDRLLTYRMKNQGVGPGSTLNFCFVEGCFMTPAEEAEVGKIPYTLYHEGFNPWHRVLNE